ncbi:MAG: hypothetical protein AABX29_01180 [Nanoarchaeota archaeon]
MKILFICKFNRYRSNIALALFKKQNKNKNLQARASGIIQGPPTIKKMREVAKEFNVTLKDNPKSLTEANYNWADLVVIVGNDIPKRLFDNIEGTPREVIVWKLKDVMQFDLDYHENTRLLTKKIENKVKKLVKKYDKLSA